MLAGLATLFLLAAGCDEDSAPAPVTVLSVTVQPGTTTLAKGLTLQLTAIATLSNGGLQDITTAGAWFSNASGVAAVSTTGLVTADASGTATITFTGFGNGLQNSATITVAPLFAIAVTPGSATTIAGGSQQFTATATLNNATQADVTNATTWSSSATNVATISTGGLVTALASGSTTVTATDVSTGIQGTATLTVIPAGTVVVSIAVTPNSPTGMVSSAEQFTAIATYDNGSQGDISASATWASSDPSVATVTSGGLATALTSGSAAITATDAAGGVLGTATLTVPATNLGLITPTPVTTTTTSPVAGLSVTIPQNVVAIGISVKGTNFLFKFVDHGLLTEPTPVYITGPGGNVPLSFNMIDSNGDGTETPLGDNLLNFQVASLFFPNDGTTPALAAGTYTFPIASFNATGTGLSPDTLTPLVYYKTNISAQQTMKVNLLVVQGVSAGISDDASAAADPEIQGAIQVLRNVYQNQVGLIVDVTVRVVGDASFVGIDSLGEQHLLLSSFPTTATNDALNLFIVGSLNWVPTSVIGLSTGVPGPFNLQRTILSGTLAEYQGDGTGSVLGYILAHEFGHYLGLWHTSQTSTSGPLKIIGHDPIGDTAACTTAQVTMSGNINNCPDLGNVMFPSLLLPIVTNPPITAGQATVVKLNPAIMVR